MIAAAAFPNLDHGDLALPTVITQLVPIWAGILLLAAIFSAELSSADAVLFMLTTSLARDLYQRFLHPDVTESKLLRLSRGASFLAGTAAVILAVILPSVISALTIFYSLLSVALFVPVLAGLYWSKPGPRTCLQAVLLSVAATIVIHFTTSGEGIFFLSPTALGICVSALSFSLAGRLRFRKK
jgi:SSS family solute:Na+ symporter